MSPTRRTFLRAGSLMAVTLVAGCTAGGSSGSDDPTDEPTAEPTMEPTTGEPTTDGGLPGGNNSDNDSAGGTRPAGTGGPGIIIADTDDAPDLPLTPAVAVTRDVATEEHPPQLEVTLTNDSDDALQIGEGRAVVFAYVQSDTEQLTLLPADSDYDAEAGCWRLTSPIAVTQEYRMLTMQPGESVSQLVDVYGTAGKDGCLPIGEHRFETTYTVARGEDGLANGEETTEANWGFTVLME